MFKHYTRRPRAVQSSYYAGDIAKMYNWPDADGTGQTIAFIELGGGYSMKDLQTYATRYNLPPIDITAVEIGAAKNNPADPSGASDEILLDIEVAYAVAPGARFRVYFAPNTDAGFLNAIKQAIADKVDIISISWGGSEDSWSFTTIQEFEAVFKAAADAGITVLAASGDSGYLDSPNTSKPTVDYPASSCWVLACGGTQITSTDEITWNNLDVGEGATGGGESSLFSRPAWQTRDHIDKQNRSVPDLTANASPLTGYNIVVNGVWSVIAGTSSCSPLYAGLFARINQILGTKIGYANPVLYMLNERSWYDVTQGNNGYWKANAHFDLTSGLGRLKGDTLVEDIKWAIDNVK